jgi:serine/threonine-protein kinase
MAERLEGIYQKPKTQMNAPVPFSNDDKTRGLLPQPASSSEQDFFTGRQADAEYARAFRDFGIDIDALAPAEAAAQITGRGISPALVKALDEWGPLRRRARSQNDPGWKKLVEIARLADPDPGRIRCREALLHRDRRGLEELADAVPVHHVPPATLWLLGVTLKELGDLDKAMDLLKRAQQQYPSDLLINDTLGDLSWNAFQPPRMDDALRFYSMALVLRPTRPQLHLVVGVVLSAKDDVEGAIREFQAALKIDPNNAGAHFHLGNALHEKKDLEGAIREFQAVIKINPNHAGTHYNLGNALTAKGQIDDAIREYQASLKIDPNGAGAHYNLGNALMAKGQIDDAIREYQAALKIGPGDRDGLFRALARQGQLEKVIEELRAAWQKDLEHNPPEHRVWLGYAELCAFLGRQEEYHRHRAALLARFGETTDPVIAECVSRACLLLPASADELSRAAALADQAVAAGPTHPSHVFFLAAKGLAEYRSGRFDSAIDWLQQAEARGSTMPVTHLVLAMARYRSGQDGQSRATLAAALRSNFWGAPSILERDKWIAHVLRREAEPLVVPNLSAFLNGEYQPKDSKERLELIEPCRFRERYCTVARLYGDVFAAEPKLADDLKAAHRYRAACAAALAGTGQGNDAAKLNDDGRARLRQQALDWLRADLAMQTNRLQGANRQDRTMVQQKLEHWKRDADLIGIRRFAALAKLPAGERTAWVQLWDDVETLLRKIRGQQK